MTTADECYINGTIIKKIIKESHIIKSNLDEVG